MRRLPYKDEAITLEEVREFLQGRAAKFKFPAQIELVKELPMTSSGKIKKMDLKEREKGK